MMSAGSAYSAGSSLTTLAVVEEGQAVATPSRAEEVTSNEGSI